MKRCVGIRSADTSTGSLIGRPVRGHAQKTGAGSSTLWAGTGSRNAPHAPGEADIGS